MATLCIDSLSSQTIEWMSSSRSLSNELSDVIGRLEVEHTKELAEFSNKSDALQKQIHEMEQRVGQLWEDDALLREKKAEHERQIASLEEKHHVVRTSVVELEAEVTRLHEEKDEEMLTKTREKEELTTQVHKLQQQARQLQDEQAAMERNIALLTERDCDLHAEVKKKEDKLRFLSKQRSIHIDASTETDGNSDIEAAATHWVYATSKCLGMPVGPDVLAGRDGWCFVDHKDGTGIVYWWPLPTSPDREKEIHSGINALPVQEAKEDITPGNVELTSKLSLPPSTRSITDVTELRLSTATFSGLCKEVGMSEQNDMTSVVDSPASKDVDTLACQLPSLEEQLPRRHSDSTVLSSSHRNPSSSPDNQGSHRRSSSTGTAARTYRSGPTSAVKVDEVKDVYMQVDQRLSLLGFKSRDVGGGGNCFFRALAAQHPDLMNNPSMHRQARLRTVRYMRMNEATFSNSVPSKSYSSYVDHMSEDGTWVEGEVELHSAAAAWNVNIHIWSESDAHDRRFLAPNPTIHTFNVCMAHYRDQHYRVVEAAN
jgi:hypothetical protein